MPLNKCILILAAIFSLPINSQAIEINDGPKFSSGHGIGLAIGGPAILGVSYRKFFDNRIGIQTSFLAFPYGRQFDIISGAHLSFTFSENPKMPRLYALVGATVIFESTSQAILIPGVGAGGEFMFKGNFALAVECLVAPAINIGHQQHKLGYIPFPFVGFVLTYYI